MHKRQLTIVGIVLIAATILLATVAFRQQAQDKTQIQQDKPAQDEVTVIQKGQARSDEEHAFSQEYKKLYSYRQGKKISEVSEASKARGNKQDIRIVIGIGDTVNIDNPPMPTKSEFLKDLSCHSDLVVVGSINGKTSHLTDDESFIYTEYEFSVKNILKNNPMSSIEVNGNIKVTRPGGSIKLDNQIIRAEDLSYEPLQKNKEYLLFLQFVPTGNGYIVSSKEGDFILENKSFKKLSKVTIPQEMSINNSESLINDVSDSISSGCRNLTGVGVTQLEANNKADSTNILAPPPE